MQASPNVSCAMHAASHVWRWCNMQPTCNVSETNLGVIGFLWLMMYRPLAEGVVAARMCALATSLTSTMTGVPAMTSLSRQAYCKAD